MKLESPSKEITIHFGIDRGEIKEVNKIEGQDKSVEFLNCFKFYDYNNWNSNIGYLKEYFLITFGDRYSCCRCQLSVYHKLNNKYKLLSPFEESKLMYDELYLIKIKKKCDCEFQKYGNYLTITKFDIVTKLKYCEENYEKTRKELEEVEQKMKDLQIENDNLKKTEEIKNNSKVEDFYDIVIDINSIKNINKEGWAIKHNDKGFGKYNKYKNEELITIGVLGNNNKGKSFLLSKISKIKLPTGTSIETKGLSVKYPDLKDHKGRHLIFLDSAGLETPVLRKDKDSEEKELKQEEKEIDLIDKKNDNKIEENKEEKDKEKRLNKKFKENAKDKIMTEAFLQNIIIKFSDILLMVVGKLTYSEQLLINKIKVESQSQNKDRIIIIHNLQEFRTVDQVETYIKETLLKCSTFDLKKQTWISTEANKVNEENKNQENELKEKKDNKQEEENKEKGEKEEEKEDNKQEEDKKENEENEENEEEEDNKKNNEDKDIIINEIKNEPDDLEIKINENQNEGQIKINPDQNEDKFKNNIINDNENKFELFENNENLINNNLNKDLQNNQNYNKANDHVDKKENANLNENKKSNDIHFTEIVYYGVNKKLEIFHLIIANEDSEAGNFYNQHAYDFIGNIYNLISEPKKFDVVKEVKDSFLELSEHFLIDDIKKNEFTKEEQLIKLDNPNELTLKNCYTDELGFSLFKTGKFEPKYNYFKSDDNTLEIRLEVPGNIKIDVNHQVQGDKTIITVSGNKLKEKKPEEPYYNLGNTREFTEFNLDIALKVEDFKIKEKTPKEGYPKFVNGVCLIQYELVSEAVQAEGGANSEEL